MFVDLKNINIGDILLESVENLNGTILASKNSLVDAEKLYYFNLWGIKQVNIVVEQSKGLQQKKNSKDYNINRVMNTILETADKIKSERIVDII